MSLRTVEKLARRLRRFGTAAACAGLLAGTGSKVTAADGASPLLMPPPVPGIETSEPDLMASNRTSFAEDAPSNAELARRLRELESRYAEQSVRYASLAAETADGKKDEKKDEKKGTVVGSDTKMSGNWKDGAYLETSDKAFKMKWRGRTQFDYTGFTDSDAYFRGLTGNQGQQAVDFRRLRLGTEGTFWEQFDFAVELDFINSFNTNGSTNDFGPNNNLKNAYDRQFFGVPAPTDVWVGVHEVPLINNARIGNVKPCNGLEHANSSRFLDFMERSLNQDAFTGRFNNGFQPGILLWNYNEAQTVTWHTSVTKNSYNVFAYDSGSSGWDYANRVTWTPIYDEASHGRYLVHLGFSATERTCTDGQDRLRARGSLRNGISQSWSSVADTTIFFSTNETLLIPEIAAVYGPWHFQAEYFGQWNSNVRTQQPSAVTGPNPGPNLGTAYFQGYYAQVSYFLTGEHREYERKTASFGRVVPYENFQFIRNRCGGPVLLGGAWQVLYRYELLDLNDPRLANVNADGGGAAGVGGGTVYGHTIGLNHFINPNMKVQYNTWISDRTASAATPPLAGQPQTGGQAYGFGARLAIDF
jgi:phosphate-selective porin OprO/OprP